MTEFDLIYQKINTQNLSRNDVLVGIGDDCAIMTVPAGHSLAVSMDTLVAGVHFPVDSSAYTIGYKALAVNLSDLAASAAEPAWFTLSLTMPTPDEQWLTEFVRGVYDLANKHKVQLVGGDTTKGPLAITIQAHGFVKSALLRSDAVVGDDIYISGYLGQAALGFECYKNNDTNYPLALSRFLQPEPRVELGLMLQTIAHACIDISDGLFADINHICKQSNCGAEINIDAIPLTHELEKNIQKIDDRLKYFTFGDDYELCFTSAVNHREAIASIAKEANIKLTRIGSMINDNRIKVVNDQQQPIDIQISGYQHFYE